ncbi:DUF2167 domain-containing protein [Myxococcus dinghuensis]|uniref:DUF2167 domain-containing protein n=1 Tax=Myxococcus dinghuensis TaxID=2906761 RepID=UPI00225DFDCB|nr:DUF2167 domain-containing protein [Myxococcus dinghuensis]
MKGRWWLSWMLSVVAVSAWAQGPAAEPPAQADAEVDEPPFVVEGRTGTVDLGHGLAQMEVPANFLYLSPEEAERVLVEAWGNPPGTTTLGMLVPANVDVAAPEGWGVVISYDDDGHVEDEDASSIDYADLLKEMQSATRESSAERKKAGYGGIQLVGWAATPHYDPGTRKLYWAKELASTESNDSPHSLNYNVRILGNEGVLVLNAVSEMGQLPQVEKDMQQVLGFTSFKSGYRYEDFDPSSGRVAAYGIAGLVAGKMAVKAGFFKGLLAALFAAKKLVIAGVAALFVGLSKLFKRGNNDDTP